MKELAALLFLILLGFCLSAQDNLILGEWTMCKMFMAKPEMTEISPSNSVISFGEDGKVSGSFYSMKADGGWSLEGSLLKIIDKSYQLKLLTAHALLLESNANNEQVLMAYTKGTDTGKAQTDLDAYFLENYSIALIWEPLFKIVESMPVMLECDGIIGNAEKRKCNEEKIAAFIKENISPEYKDLKGKTQVNFIVEKDGTITNPIATRSMSEDAKKEAVRLVKLMPKWAPGKQRGVPVRVMSIQFLDFNPTPKND